MLRRLAGPMARNPLVALLIALLVSAGAATGFLRFSVDAGQSLLVGSSSAAGQANQRFTASFGTDPIVVVLTARNPTAPYIERNLQKLAALEDDLAHDPGVAEVLGPGTVARSALAATTAEVAKTLTEYPYFVAETHLLLARQQGETDATKLEAQLKKDLGDARSLLELYVGRAARDAHLARQAYEQKPIPSTDRILDGQERVADAAAAQDPLPPLFANYLAGPGGTPDMATAHQFFDRLTAAYGDCSDPIAQLLGIAPSCQVFLARFLLDLPDCPTEASVKAAAARHQQLFCPPKPQWASVLPTPSTSSSGSIVAREVITVRLTAAAAANRSTVLALRQRIDDELAHGIASDAYTQAFPAAQAAAVKALGALAPTDCGDVGAAQNASCYTSFNNSPFTWVIAGAPLLTYGVVDSMTQTLLILLPFVFVLMAVLLVATFRLRGRLWPLLAALAAGGATLGLSLWFGIAVTPAVLAGIPVLIGLGVDYAVQLVARYDEERCRGADREAALAEALGRSGPATLTAALATLAGLGALTAVAGIDAGPLVAVPLVAEFALVLCVGVVLAWLTAMFVALPAAALGDHHPRAQVALMPAVRRPERTLAIASSWRGALVPAVIVALIGWILLPGVPVQTDVEQLLAPSLPEVQAIDAVRAQTGYSNEVDIFLQGQVAGPYTQPGIPDNVTWQCRAAQAIRSDHPDQVALATSIADFFIASSSSATASTRPPCTTPSSPSPSTSPTPAASPTAGASATPSASTGASPSAGAASASPAGFRLGTGRILLAATAVATQSAVPSPVASPAASPAASPSGSAAPTVSPSPSSSPVPAQQSVTQTAFVCDLRLLPALSRDLVQAIPTTTQPCPAVDKYFNTWLSTDTTPIDPTTARIVVGVEGASVAEQARLLDGIRNDLGSPPRGITAVPAGIAALAAQAYDNIVARGLLLNLVPLAVVFLALLAIERDLRRAALPVLPTAIAAGWAPLILRALSLLPGGLGTTLGSFNPLTVVLGALVIALATEFGVVLLRRFDEEVGRGLSPDDAAAAALAVTGRAIRVSALTLGAGFAVLALSALLPRGLPLLGSFGFTVLIDLALAVAAVFGIMLPVAVAIERHRPHPALLAVPAAVAATVERSPRGRPARRGDPGGTAPAETGPAETVPGGTAPGGSTPATVPRRPAGPRLVDVTPAGGMGAEPGVVEQGRASDLPGGPGGAPDGVGGGRRRRGVSGRRRPPAPGGASSPDPTPPPAPAPRRPGVSGRRRGPKPGGGAAP